MSGLDPAASPAAVLVVGVRSDTNDDDEEKENCAESLLSPYTLASIEVVRNVDTSNAVRLLRCDDVVVDNNDNGDRSKSRV